MARWLASDVRPHQVPQSHNAAPPPLHRPATAGPARVPACPPAGCAAPWQSASPRRRALLLALPALTLAQLPAAHASENAGGVDSASSPLVQELLRRTEDNREQRKKDRLDDYYRRNYQDYFSSMAPAAEGQASDNDQAIRAWLRQNAAPAIPTRAPGQTFPADK